MPTTLRIATFNAENLFDRAKVFDLDWDKGGPILANVAALQAELRKVTFDKTRIRELLNALKGYAKIVEVRGKWAKAKGAKDFQGWVELTRSTVTEAAQANTARVLAAVNADIVCLVEIEDRIVLSRFHNQILAPKHLRPRNLKPYSYNILIDGNDTRGIDVAVMSRYPLGAIRTHIHDRQDGQLIFSRDCLEVEVLLPTGQSCWVLANHFKSQGYNDKSDPGGRKRRRAQAERVAEILQGRDLQNGLVIVAGDLNDTPDSTALVPLTSHPGLFNMNEQLPSSDRWTYHFSGKNQQLDYLLVSLPLKAALQKVEIERRGIFKVEQYSRGAVHPFPTVKSDRDSASDHGAVVAEFAI